MKKIGFILGRRIRGNIELDLDPLTQRLGEILSPGARIAGRPEQDILEVTEDQNYVIGSRRYVDDRVFRYCHSKEALAYRTGAFMDKLYYWEGEAEGGWGEGVKVFEFDNTGVLIGTPIPAHALKDGWAISGQLCQRIKDNEGEVGGVTSITLYRGLSHALTDAQGMYVYPNIYANLMDTGGDGTHNADIGANPCYGTVVCVPLTIVPLDRYFWGLTCGIFYGVCGQHCGGPLGSGVGEQANNRTFGFDQLGHMVHRIGGHAAGDGEHQPGGYIMMDGHGATTGGDQLCFLQLAP